MKRFIIIGIIFSCFRMQAAEEIEKKPSEINYTQWVLRRKNKQPSITFEDYHLVGGPEDLPIKTNCLLHIFACICCSKTIQKGHEELIKHYKDSCEFVFIGESRTLRRFYRYK